MAKKDESDWPELKVVDKRVAKVRAQYCSLKFDLSDKPEPEWATAFHEAVGSDAETVAMERNAPTSVDDDVVTWEVHQDDIEAAWKVVKRAVEAANEKYATLHAARTQREANLQSRLDDRDKLHKKLDDKFQALK